MARPAESNDRWWLAVAVLTALALALRIIGMRETPAGDELILRGYLDHHSFARLFDSVVTREKTPPLGFMLSWLSTRLGPVDAWMRLPSVLAGTALVPLSALLGRRAAGTGVGLIASAIAALSPFLLYYGIEARAYALSAALVCAGMILLLRACESSTPSRWVAWTAVTFAALMTHYTVVFAVAAGIGWALWTHRERRRPLLLCVGAVALLCLPWLPSLLTQWGNSDDEAHRIADLAPLTTGTLWEVASRAVAGHPLWSSLRSIELTEVPGTAGLSLILIGIALAVGSTVLDWVRDPERSLRIAPTTAFLIVTAVATPLGLVLLSLRPHHSFLLPRNLIASLPATAVLVAMPIARCRRPLNVIAAAMVIGGLAIGSIRELTLYSRPQMKAAAEAIAGRWQPGDPILRANWLNGPPTDLTPYLPAGADAYVGKADPTSYPAYESALRTGHPVFTVSVSSDFSKGPAGPPPLLREGFELVWSKSWRGMADVTAAEWRRLGG